MDLNGNDGFIAWRTLLLYWRIKQYSLCTIFDKDTPNSIKKAGADFDRCYPEIQKSRTDILLSENRIEFHVVMLHHEFDVLGSTVM